MERVVSVPGEAGAGSNPGQVYIGRAGYFR